MAGLIQTYLLFKKAFYIYCAYSSNPYRKHLINITIHPKKFSSVLVCSIFAVRHEDHIL
jgi:hypothetical protein